MSWIMLVCSWLSVVFLLVQSCFGNRRPGFDVGFATPHPKAKPQRDPTHISDFTDPDTGLNPFLDLQEGRSGGLGRRVMEGDQPVLWPPDFQIVEGGPEDPSKGGPFNPRWMEDSDFTEGSDNPSTYESNRRFLELGLTPVEAEGKLSEEESTKPYLPELTLTLSPGHPFTENPVTSQNYDVDYDDKHEFLDVESMTSEPENPFSWNVMISALATGLALLALIVAFCWWRRRSKRLVRRAGTDVESRNSETANASTKQNGNNSVLRK